MASTSDFWSVCPLGVKLHSFLGSFDDTQWEGYGHDVENNAFELWRRERGISNLELFRKVINGDETQAQRFKDSLSLSQLVSWRLIN